MPKKTSRKKLIEKLDYVFQESIRWRDRHTCITCGKKFTQGERTLLHAGHFISRRHYSIRWDEENVHAQCAGCNLAQSHGSTPIILAYERAIELKCGRGTVERLLRKKNETAKFSLSWLEANIELYTNYLKELRG